MCEYEECAIESCAGRERARCLRCAIAAKACPMRLFLRHCADHTTSALCSSGQRRASVAVFVLRAAHRGVASLSFHERIQRRSSLCSRHVSQVSSPHARQLRAVVLARRALATESLCSRSSARSSTCVTRSQSRLRSTRRGRVATTWTARCRCGCIRETGETDTPAGGRIAAGSEQQQQSRSRLRECDAR